MVCKVAIFLTSVLESPRLSGMTSKLRHGALVWALRKLHENIKKDVSVTHEQQIRNYSEVAHV